jgi:uncharacterized protein (TIGR02246 family)
MKKFLLSALFLLTIWVPNYSFGQSNTFTNSDSLAIKKTSHNFEVAFNNHDAKSLATLFLADGEFTNVVGVSAKGRKAIEEFHAPMFEGKPGYFSFKNSTLKNETPKISVIRPDVASVDVFWSMDRCFLPDGSELKNRRGLITLLMVKENGNWGIAIMHNAELSPANH